MELEEEVDDSSARAGRCERDDRQHLKGFSQIWFLAVADMPDNMHDRWAECGGGTYAVSENDDDHDAGNAKRAAHKYGVHVDHGQRAAPGDDQTHDCDQEAVDWFRQFFTIICRFKLVSLLRQSN